MKLDKVILLNEKVGFIDLVLKYTLRDFVLGILRYIPSSIGIGLRMLVIPLFLNKTGYGLTVKEGVIFKFPERIKMGNHVGLSENCIIDGDGGIEIGNYVRIAPNVTIVSFEHNYMNRNIPIKLQGKTIKKVVIGDDVWIGTGAVVLAGVEIGQGAVIGANSVVNKNVDSYSVVAGCPIRLINTRK